MAVEQVGYNNGDGITMGSASTVPISFYNATPITRYVGVGAASTYLTTTNTTATAGFTTVGQANSLILQVSTITVALRNLGLID